jgi:hypothetical protein
MRLGFGIPGLHTAHGSEIRGSQTGRRSNSDISVRPGVPFGRLLDKGMSAFMNMERIATIETDLSPILSRKLPAAGLFTFIVDQSSLSRSPRRIPPTSVLNLSTRSQVGDVTH